MRYETSASIRTACSCSKSIRRYFLDCYLYLFTMPNCHSEATPRNLVLKSGGKEEIPRCARDDTLFLPSSGEDPRRMTVRTFFYYNVIFPITKATTHPIPKTLIIKNKSTSYLLKTFCLRRLLLKIKTMLPTKYNILVNNRYLPAAA